MTRAVSYVVLQCSVTTCMYLGPAALWGLGLPAAAWAKELTVVHLVLCLARKGMHFADDKLAPACSSLCRFCRICTLV